MIIAIIDWNHVWPLIGMAITSIGTALIGLYRHWQSTGLALEHQRQQLGNPP